MRANGIAGWTAVAGVAVALTACGGGGGGGGGSSAPIAETAIDGDLYLHGEHYHQDFYHHSFKPGWFWIYWDLFNSSSQALKGVPWSIRDMGTGQVVAQGTIDVPAHYTHGNGTTSGTGHDHQQFFDYSGSVGRHQLQLEIDPANRVHETDESNNTYLFTVDVPTDPGQHVPQDDLHWYAAEAHFHDNDPALGDLDFHFVFENTKSVAVTGVTWELKSLTPGFDYDQTFTFNGTVQPGETGETSHPLTVPPGEYDIEMILDPAHAFTAATDDGHVRVFHVSDAPGAGG